MPYLNLDLNYFDHPKTRRLIGMLGRNADIYPLRLWAYCGKIHAKDGTMKGYSKAEIEGVIHWKGTPGVATTALVKVGFIRAANGGYACIDWHQHQGHLEAFSRRGRENAKKRWDMVRGADASSNAKSKSGNARKQSGNAPTEPTEPTEPNQPNHTNRTGKGNGERPVDLGEQFRATVKDLADKKARAAKQDKLLGLKWNVQGAHNGRLVQDLEPDYCRWAIANLTTLGQEYKDALAVRLEQKTSEAI